MSHYRRSRRPAMRPDAPRICKTPGCRNHRSGAKPFCGSCWYALTPAFRIAIDQACETGRFGHPGTLIRSAGLFIQRQARADRRGEPADVAFCSRCQRASCDATVGACCDSSCPFALQVAA